MNCSFVHTKANPFHKFEESNLFAIPLVSRHFLDDGDDEDRKRQIGPDPCGRSGFGFEPVDVGAVGEAAHAAAALSVRAAVVGAIFAVAVKRKFWIWSFKV
jgi:hypothetical protein